MIDAVKAMLQDEKLCNFAKELIIKEDTSKEINKRFNFFTLVSDYYYRETFHSDVLAAILNPRTPEIGLVNRRVFLPLFFDMVGIKGLDENDYDCIKVTTEASAGTDEKKGRIDIEISLEKKFCIVLENKMNWAEEQKDQMARYISEREGRYPVVIGICLYPYPNLIAEPSILGWSKKYDGIVKRISNSDDKSIQLFMWAASKSHSFPQKEGKKWYNTSLCDILETALNRINKGVLKADFRANECTAYVFYSQYRRLIQVIGGEMENLIEKKELVDYLVSHSEVRKQIETVADCWNARRWIFNPYFYERFVNQKEYQSIVSELQPIKIKGYKYLLLDYFGQYSLVYWANTNPLGNNLDFYFFRKDEKPLNEEDLSLIKSVLAFEKEGSWDGPSTYNNYAMCLSNVFLEGKKLDDIYSLVFQDVKTIVERARTIFQ